MRSYARWIALAAWLLALPARTLVLNEGDILISDYALPGVIRVDPTTGDQDIVAQGDLLAAGSKFPAGIAADLAAQRVYVGMTHDREILAIEASDGSQSVFSSDAILLQHPRAIVFDTDGSLLVADGDALVRVPSSGGAPAFVAGDLAGAIGLAREPNGDVLVACTGLNGVGFGSDGFLARVDPDSHQSTPIVAAGTTLIDPTGVARALQGEIVLSDWGNNAVYQVDPQDGSLAPLLSGNGPQSVAIDPEGRLLVLEGNTAITRYDLGSTTPTPIVGPGGAFTGAEQFTVVTTPEPAGSGLAAAALLGVAVRRGRRRRATSLRHLRSVERPSESA